jgi:hypothetical protein
MVPAKLQQPLHTKLVDWKDKPVAFLNINVMKWSNLKLIWHQSWQLKSNMYEAS